MNIRLVMVYFLTVAICFSSLSGCAGTPAVSPESTAPITEPAETLQVTTQNEPKAVEQVGAVPDSLSAVVEKNLFHEAVASGGRLLKTTSLEESKEEKTVRHQVQMLDLCGRELARYESVVNDAYRVDTLTATSDGGFLFVLAFEDRAYSQDSWARDNGFASRVIKCDKDGKLLFDTALDAVEGSALRFCFEKNGQFYLFGTRQTPETKIQGTHSSTDVYMTILDESGAVVNTQCIAGSDFDSVDNAELSGDHFLLSISSQSMDGDFVGSTTIYPIDWIFTVDNSLQITDKRMASGKDCFDHVIGERDSLPLYLSDQLFHNFDGGSPTAYVDYDDFYLIVSENATGIYENTPIAISSIWYYWETVYSGYDKEGQLLFRASVDSSPDYEAYTKEILSN